MDVEFRFNMVIMILFWGKECYFMFYKILDGKLLSSSDYKVMDIIVEVVSELVKCKEF